MAEPGAAVLLENLNAFTAFARKRLGDPDLAADLVQDSLLKALQSTSQPPDREGAVRWFYRILRHAIIDLHRRREVRDRASERLQTELAEAPDAEAEAVLCRCVQRLLPGLPDTYREALRRIDVEGASPADAASELGISTNSLHVRLHRARRRLRDELEATCRLCSTHGCLDCSCPTEAS